MAVVKNLPIDAGDARDVSFDPWVKKSSWRRKWQPTSVFLPGKFHGQGGLWAAVHGVTELDTTEHMCTHTPTLVDEAGTYTCSLPPEARLLTIVLHWWSESEVKVKSLSRVRPSATPWTAVFQAPPSMGFSRQEYRSGVPRVYPKMKLYACCFPWNLMFSNPAASGDPQNSLQDLKMIILVWLGYVQK